MYVRASPFISMVTDRPRRFISMHDPSAFGLSTASAPRRLVLQHGSLEHALSVPANLHATVMRSRDAFLSTLSLPRASGTSNDQEDQEPASGAELVACYLEYLTREVEEKRDDASGSARTALKLVLDDFEAVFCRGNDVHLLVEALTTTERQKNRVIRSYYAAQSATNVAHERNRSALSRAALDGKANVYAIFGGQGYVEGYLGELRQVHDTYGSLVGGLISSSSELLRALSQHPAVAREHPRDLNVLEWLRDPDSTPPLEYLMSAPVSFPLIGLVQLAHYAVTCRVLGCTPREFLRCLCGTTGHSQGIVVAAAVATADTWDSFQQLASSALTVLFWIGVRSQQTYPPTSVAPARLRESIENGEGVPSPMLTISNLPRVQVQEEIDAINRQLPKDRHVAISLVNGHLNMVVNGPPLTLYALNIRLRSLKAPAGLDQTRIPFAERRRNFAHRFLPVTVPFHSEHLLDAIPLLENDLEHIKISSDGLRIPVYATDTGEDLKATGIGNLVPALIRLIARDPVDWPKASRFLDATHVLDFGPGGLSGVGSLTHRNKAGTGVRVIIAGAMGGNSSDVGYKPEIFDRDQQAMRYGLDWQKQFGPKLLKTAAGDILVDTKMSRLLGTPPVMVAGMTPCTVPWDFVAATMNAGYHVELAGGGYHDSLRMGEALAKLENAIPAGRGITVNLIYANPRAMQWQVPLIRQLRADGFPIDGLTIGAGMPSIEVANEYITTLDLKHISFKPGSMEAIQQVIDVAKANPQFPIILQWTGGRAGGHHSFEDVHQPILQTYATIRRCQNIILVIGSGFGGAEDTYPYLTGAWSVPFGYAPMPFDGCLFGSRVMTAKEAHTSPAAKRAITEAKGLEEGEWAKTYKGPAGGVITVLSEMGEPIHKLATRGVLFWAEMDRTIFSLEKGKRTAELTKKRSYIIEKLNKDFQKVWFGRNAADEAVDLEDMTYTEVVHRMVELMFVRQESRWIDHSYKLIVGDFVRRVEERSVLSEGQVSLLGSYDELSDPYPVIQEVLSVCQTADQLISAEDVRYLLLLCRRPGQKPVPFVPVLDEDFEYWFKKDSLWQSEDLEAVVEQDVGRTCILQGPVAVKFSKIVDEPVKDILDGIHQGYISRLTQDVYGADATIPRLEYLGDMVTESEASLRADGLLVADDGKKITYHLSISPVAVLPSSDSWLALLGGRPGSWRHAFFTTKSVLQYRTLQANPMRRMFAPRNGLTVEIINPDDSERTIVSMHEVSQSPRSNQSLEIKLGAKGEIEVRMFALKTAERKAVALTIRYAYLPYLGCCPIREIMESRNDRVKAFYYRVWFGNTKLPTDSLATTQYDGGSMTILREALDRFARAVGITGEDYTSRPGRTIYAPMDFAIVVAWKVLIKPLFSKAIDGDLLSLVHLSNNFRMFPDAAPLRENDVVHTSSQVNSVLILDVGKVVEVCATITRNGKSVMEVTSQFLYRGTYDDFETTFQKKIERPMRVKLSSHCDDAVLRSKAWFHLADTETSILGQTLTFRMQTVVQFKSKTTYSSVETLGRVFVETPTKAVQVATVDYRAGPSCGNPVLDYLQRHGSAIEHLLALETSISLTGQTPLVMTVPESNEAYAEISGDYNPIHVSRIFSSYVDLPGTITHGMYSSAAVRNIVDASVTGNNVGRMRRFETSFVGMVLPKDEIEIELQHTSMIEGRKVITLKATSRRSGEKVLTGEVEIEPAVTSYLFTGQGSQLPKMGMELYASSAVARGVWDNADKFFEENYGEHPFSFTYDSCHTN